MMFLTSEAKVGKAKIVSFIADAVMPCFIAMAKRWIRSSPWWPTMWAPTI